VKKKIWILSLYEPTLVDNTRPMRYMSIADALNKNGVEVTYFSSTFRHANKHVRFEAQTEMFDEQGVKTVFIQSPGYTKNLSRARIKAHKVYTENLMKYFRESESKPDLILSAFPPIDTPLEVSIWAKEKGIPFVFDIIDPWPDVILRVLPDKLKTFGLFFIGNYNKKVKRLIQNANGIVAISNQYIDWVKTKQAGTYKTAAFYPTVPFKEVQQKLSRIERKDSDKLRIIYAGNLGIAYDIPCILKAAEKLESDHPGKTHFAIAGVGDHEGLVKEYASRLGNIVYLGRIGYDDLLVQYANTDLGLAQYSKGATQSVTYKFFDYLSAGIPILNSLKSEMWELIDEKSIGANNLQGDYDTLAKNITSFHVDKNKFELYRSNALNFTAEKGDNEVVYKAFAEFLLDFTNTN
jgi:hypothetical protein